MASVGQMAGGIVHDFNNALAIISGYSTLIEERMNLDEKGRRYTQQIGIAAGRAGVLSRQLLDSIGRQLLKPVRLNLNEVVAGMEEILRQIVGGDVTMTVILDPELGTITASPEQIEQVLLNLTMNARDAMPLGGELVIRTANALDASQPRGSSFSSPAGYVSLSITDSGSGMDQATQSHMFEPFFSTKEAGKGTGLGLSTVKTIVEDNGGWILVDSKSGRGTSFAVYLPIVKGILPVIVLPQPIHGTLRGSEVILVIEDENKLRTLISDTLRNSGYTVLEASDRASGFELAQQNYKRIDLVLTDVALPDIRSAFPAKDSRVFTPGTRVLFMSGYTDSYFTESGILSPNTPLLEDPFDLALMLLAVRKVLDGLPQDSRATG
jgi:CheY-like chemotaxis protein